MKKSIKNIFFVFLCSMLFVHGAATPAYAVSPQEEKRINAMINSLERQADIIFIRNGSEHSGAEAAAHLRLKLGNTGNRIDTAEQFIDKVASASSVTGKPYLVRFPGKAEETANKFLHKLLQQLTPPSQ